MSFALIIISLIILAAALLAIAVKSLQVDKEKNSLEAELIELKKTKEKNELECNNFEEAVKALQGRLDSERSSFELSAKESEKRFKTDLEEIQVMNEKLERQKNVLEEELLKAKSAIRELKENTKQSSSKKANLGEVPVNPKDDE